MPERAFGCWSPLWYGDTLDMLQGASKLSCKHLVCKQFCQKHDHHSKVLHKLVQSTMRILLGREMSHRAWLQTM